MDNFLEQQETAAPESEGAFSYNQTLMLKKYESLLEDYRDGLLFFFQAAQRWGASLVDVKVKSYTITIEIHLPEEARHNIQELEENPDIVKELLPIAHPLFEIGHAFRVLAVGNPNTSQYFEIKSERASLLIIHKDDTTLRKLLSVGVAYKYHACRHHFRVHLRRRIWSNLKIKIDAQSFPRGSEYQGRIHHAVDVPVGAESTEQILAHFVHRDSRSYFLERRIKYTEFPVTQPEWPLFTLEHPYPDHEVFFRGRSFGDLCLVPVRFGIALEPILVPCKVGAAAVAFKADHLNTDFSGFQLLEDEAYNQEVQRCKQIAREALQNLYEVESNYQPNMDRMEILGNAAKWTVGAPVLAFLFTFGGLWGSSWVAFWKLFYGSTAAAGFHSYARHIPDPSTYTRAMRKTHLNWMTDEEVLAEARALGREITPPDFDKLPEELD